MLKKYLIILVKKMEYALDAYLRFSASQESNNRNHKISLLLVPYTCNKNTIYDFIIKHSDTIANNHKLVDIEKKNNPNIILFEEFNKYQEENNGMVFIINNIDFFFYYSIDNINKNNVLLFLMDINDILNRKNQTLTSNINNNFDFKYNYLYPRNFCMNINIKYNKQESYIIKEQLATYKKEYLKYIKNEDFKGRYTPDDILNIYLDDKIKSIENLSLADALLRSPKFKSILVNLLINNKKRHFIRLIDNRSGIDSFVELYNKLNTDIQLMVIRTKNSYEEKEKIIKKINENNSPIIIVSDYYPVKNLTPQNINVYHICDGGDKEDIITIFNFLNLKHNNSVINRDFEIINHIVSTFKGEFTLNQIKETSFHEMFNRLLNNYEDIKKHALTLYLEGTEIKVEN